MMDSDTKELIIQLVVPFGIVLALIAVIVGACVISGIAVDRFSERNACIQFAMMDTTNKFQFDFWTGCVVIFPDGTTAFAGEYMQRFNRLDLQTDQGE